jgi:nitric oxide reductase large subunit
LSLALFGFVYNLIVGKSLYNVLSTLTLLPLFVTTVALALVVLHVKKKMTVSGKLIYSLVAIAFVISLAIIGIAYFMNFSELYNPGYLFSVALSAFIVHTFYRMRKP